MSDATWTLLILLFSHAAFAVAGFLYGAKFFRFLGNYIEDFDHKDEHRSL